MNKSSYLVTSYIFKMSLLFILSTSGVFGDTLTNQATFKQLNKSQCNELIEKNIITKNNPVDCARLSKVNFSYLSDNNIIKTDGEIVVLDTIAPRVALLFDKLLLKRFYIAKASPVQTYNGDDEASMAANNTSAFNGRAITSGSKWSLHAYGAAIDINPIQNPFIEIFDEGKVQVSPAKSAYKYINRSNNRPHKTKREGMAEDVVELFAQNGFFIWGGNWSYPIDYQHFQIGPRNFVKILATKSVKKGRLIIESYINMYKKCLLNEKNSENLSTLKTQCKEMVIKSMQNQKKLWNNK